MVQNSSIMKEAFGNPVIKNGTVFLVKVASLEMKDVAQFPMDLEDPTLLFSH